MPNRLVLLWYLWLYGRHTPESALKAARRFQVIAEETCDPAIRAAAGDLADYARRLA